MTQYGTLGHIFDKATKAGKTGMPYNYVVTYDSGRVELYIDRGKDSDEINRKIFHALEANKEQIESDFGGSLEWDCREGVRMCRIRWIDETVGLQNEEQWDKIQDNMIDAMLRLEKALKEHIEKIRL